MGGSVMAQTPTYLDESGNEIKGGAAPTYLDEQGNEIGAKVSPQISPEELASRKAQSKASFEANQPSLVGGFLRSVGEQVGNVTNIKQNLQNLGSAVMNPTSGKTPVSTGLESTGNLLTDTALGLVGGYGLAKGINALPNAARAESAFNAVAGLANNVPTNLSEISPLLNKATTLAERGFTAPKAVSDLSDFLKSGKTLTYESARDFAQSMGKLSVSEMQSLKGQMGGLVNKLAGALGDANRESAASVGMGDIYDKAMSEYAALKRFASAKEIAAKYIGRSLLSAAGAAGAGAAGYGIYKALGY